MSKAFTRESDDLPDPLPVRKRSSLPPGVRNYMTPDGAREMREELDRLMHVERPALAKADPAAVRDRRQMLDQQIEYLGNSLQTAVVVEPPAVRDGTVRFGATVTVRDGSGEAETYRIVGVDQMDIDRGWISFLSPIAKVLLKGREGQRVQLRLPGGERDLEIVRVTFET